MGIADGGGQCRARHGDYPKSWIFRFVRKIGNFFVDIPVFSIKISGIEVVSVRPVVCPLDPAFIRLFSTPEYVRGPITDTGQRKLDENLHGE